MADLCLTGLEIASFNSKEFDEQLISTYEKVMRNFPAKLSGLAIYAYGSPGRYELVGGDSDADILIIERKRTKSGQKFKKLFLSELEKFPFSKLDIPDWGTLEDVETFLKTSLVEGNQILESRFIIGDREINKSVQSLIKKYNTIDRQITNIIFNRFYFDQYFKQREKNGALNVKYCPGGSRDFLFLYWFDKLNHSLSKKEFSYIPFKPKTEIAVSNLYNEKKISKVTYKQSLIALSFLIKLRRDILNLNKNSADRGLTFMDDSTVEKLSQLWSQKSKKIQNEFNKSRNLIRKLVNIVFIETINYLNFFKGNSFKEEFILAYDFPQNLVRKSKIDDLIKMAALWGASNNNERTIFQNLANQWKNTANWAVIGSIVCSPLCDSNILDNFGTGILKKKGYGYLLRVVSRNQNVNKKTLINISTDKNLEKRYSEVAKAALTGGNSEANRVI
jgi:hypothetical protein